MKSVSPAARKSFVYALMGGFVCLVVLLIVVTYLGPISGGKSLAMLDWANWRSPQKTFFKPNPNYWGN